MFLPRVVAIGSCGLTEAQVRTEVRRNRWRRLTPGVYLTRPEPPTRLDWAAAGLLVVGGEAALSGWDAARAHGVGSSRPPSSRVLLLTDGGANRQLGPLRIRPSRRGLSMGIGFVPGEIPLAPAARAVADTALDHRHLAPVRALVTGAVQRRLCTPEDLVAELHCGPRNGSALLRRALGDVLDGARSVAEAEAVAGLRCAAVPPFELNVSLVDVGGRIVAVADILWRALRAVLEVDGREFHFSEADWEATLCRHNLLTRSGLALTHYTPKQIRSGGNWLGEVVEWLQLRAAELGVAYVADARVLRNPAPMPLPGRPGT